MADRSIEDLIAASSLGTPDAVRLRESVPEERARRVVARSKEIAEEGPHRFPVAGREEVG